MNKLAYITYNKLENFLEKTAAPAAKALKLTRTLGRRTPIGNGFAGILTPAERTAGEISRTNVISRYAPKAATSIRKNLIDASNVMRNSLRAGIDPKSTPQMMNIKNKIIRYNNLGRRLLPDNSSLSKVNPATISKIKRIGALTESEGLAPIAHYILR